jgi:hypothetical protein
VILLLLLHWFNSASIFLLLTSLNYDRTNSSFWWRICAWIAVLSVRWWRFKFESMRTLRNLLQFDPICGSGNARVWDCSLCSCWFLDFDLTAKREKISFCFLWFDELACNEWIPFCSGLRWPFIGCQVASGPIRRWHVAWTDDLDKKGPLCNC